MPIFDAGDIVRVPFPYLDRPVRQHRPALVVSKVPLGDKGTLLWVLMITSAANRPWPKDVPIPAGGGSGLPVDSLVRTAKIATIEVASAEPLGTLPSGLMVEVVEQLRATIG
jgi:mRNA interferase MazF